MLLIESQRRIQRGPGNTWQCQKEVSERQSCQEGGQRRGEKGCQGAGRNKLIKRKLCGANEINLRAPHVTRVHVCVCVMCCRQWVWIVINSLNAGDEKTPKKVATLQSCCIINQLRSEKFFNLQTNELFSFCIIQFELPIDSHWNEIIWICFRYSLGQIYYVYYSVLC